jgi:tetratricopeptide (TPR) repeat protein
MEALEYQPNRFDAYEALGRAYEKQGAREKALRVYQDFLQKYSESPRAKEFKEKADRLQKN